MNENLKTKITTRLEEMEDEHGRQLLDYMEFLGSRYNRSVRNPSTMQRIAEGIEDKLGTAQISDAAARGASQVVDAAGKVMSGLAAATKAVAQELQPELSRTQDADGPAVASTSEEQAAASDEATGGSQAEEEPDPAA